MPIEDHVIDIGQGLAKVPCEFLGEGGEIGETVS